eukprot:7852825-Alexandrium_andersonii.AAC.1
MLEADVAKQEFELVPDELFGGPACSTADMWFCLGHGLSDGAPTVGAIIKPMLGLQPESFGELRYDCWLGGGYIKD